MAAPGATTPYAGLEDGQPMTGGAYGAQESPSAYGGGGGGGYGSGGGGGGDYGGGGGGAYGGGYGSAAPASTYQPPADYSQPQPQQPQYGYGNAAGQPQPTATYGQVGAGGYGAAAAQPGGYYQPVAQPYPQRRRHSTCYRVMCGICACLTFLAIIVGLVFLIAWMRCSNPKFRKTGVMYEAPGDVTSIAVKLSHGRIKVETLADPTATNVTFEVNTYAARKSALHDIKTTFTVSDAKQALLTIDMGGFNIWDCQQSRVYVKLPKALAGPPPDLRLETSNADIIVEAVNTFGALVATTSNSHVKINGPTANAFDLQTSNDEISGDITLVGTSESCAVTARTSNDKISFNAIKVTRPELPCRIKATSSNDDIRLSLNGYRGSFDAETSNGKVSVDGSSSLSTDKHSHKVGIIGAGGPATLDVRTSNDDVRISAI